MKRKIFSAMMFFLLLSISAFSDTAQESGNIKSYLEKWMTANYPVSDSRWEIWLISDIEDSEVLNHASLNMIHVRDSGRPKKIMSFLIEQNGKTFEVKARAVCFRKVMTAKDIVQRGVNLSSGHWQWEERDSALVPYNAIRDPEEVSQSRTKKVLTKGEIITGHAIERQPAIVKGKRITLEVKGEGIVLKTDAYSLEDGHIGDWIAIRQSASGKVCKGQVIHPDITRILLNRRH